MKTIGRKWNRPRGDFPATCGYCGVPWPRSRMTRDRAGHLVCPDDQRGRDVVTLSEANAQDALRQRGAYNRDGADVDTD